jgi:hypothetical protein
MHWTPDQINGLVDKLGYIVGTIVVILKLLQHNQALSTQAATSIPTEFAHKAMDAAVAAGINSSPATVVNTAPPSNVTVVEKVE